MAGNIGDLQVNLSASTSQMERDVSAALKRLESKGFNFGGGINSKAFTQPLGRITGASNEFQKSLDASNARVIAFGASAGAIYTVQRAFTSLISSTIDVQKSLTDINVILGASQKTLGQFGDQLFEIAKNSGQAFSTVATAAGELARQGLSVEQTLKRTSDALILARLSGLDAASSVEALTASINSFNTSALDSTQIVNKLASVDAAFAVSSGDLAEALKRVGSSAQDVGVTFDELLAIVASVNQTTARGGAVIGNSLKTIFTRVQRTEVLDQLQSLGVAVRDLNGNTAPAIQILTGLATKFDELGTAQKASIAELVGGVFQINILKAALGDLSKEYSVYGNALKISQGATDEAIRRNEDLNKTLSAILNKTVANLTRVGSDIGSLSFAPAIEKVLGGINTALESFDVKGDGIGSKIGKGIFEGIGSFVSGPGLALLIGVFIKLFGNLAKFTTDAARTVLGLNKESQAQAQIQERINSILSQNPQLIQNILNKQVSLLQVEKDILTVIQSQSQARQQSSAIASTLTRGLMSRGVSADKGIITTTPRTKSQGFIPNFNANQEIMGAISGGYMPGQVRSMNIPNYGRVTYNDAETVKEFSGLSQPGIMPPASSEAGKAYKQKFKDKYGINPYASSGFVPNFGAQTKQIYPYAAVKSTDRKALSKQFKAGEEADASKGYEKATEKGNIVNSRSIDRYGYIYPSFSQSSPGRAVGTSGGNKYGFTTYPFPGGNFDINENLYETVRQNLINTSSDYFKQLITQPKIVDTTRFKTNISSNLSRSAIESSLGQVFEAGIKSSISSLSLSEIANFDLNKSELSDIQQKFKLPYGGFGNTYLADLKNSLSEGNLNSMAGKISTASGEKFSGQDTIRAKKTQSRLQKDFTKQGYEKLSGAEAAFVRSGKFKNQGFIPNFSPLDRALNTEEKMGGRGVLDFKPGLGLYVRDGKTQPNFAAVMRDHPEGIANATQNSKKMQGMMSTGFIPNFAGFDPMSLFFILQSMGSGGAQGKSNLLAEEQKLGSILNQRGLVESQLLELGKKTKKNAAKYADLEAKKANLNLEEISQRKNVQSQTPIFARKGGSFVGGVGGVAGRFGSRYGSGLALAAPLLAGTAAQFVGDDVSRGGRSAKAAVSGLGTTASFAGLGFAVGGPMGAAVGGGIGGIMAGYNAIKEFNDVMPELKARAEQAQEKLSGVSSSTQMLNVSLDTLSSAQMNSGLSAEQSVRLQDKATTDFASSLSKLDSVLPGAADEITNLYKKVGDTTELRMKIAEFQAQAQKEAQISISAASLTSKGKEATNLSESFLDSIFGPLKGLDTRVKNLKPSEKRAFDDSIRSGSGDLRTMFGSFGTKAGQSFTSSESQKMLDSIKATGNLSGIESIVKSFAALDADAKYASEILTGIDLEVLKKLFEEVIIVQKRAESIAEQIQQQQLEIKTGMRPIRTIQELQQQFANPGGISEEALKNINYSSAGGIEESLMQGKVQGFAQQVGTGLTDLSTTLGFTNDRVKYLAEYTQTAADIQKDYNNGIITTTQAFERLKIKADEIKFKKDAPFMFSGERASARQGILEGNLKQGNLAEGFNPLVSFFDRFGDNAATTLDKINKSFGNLAENMQTGFEDAFGAFLDGTKSADDAFKDMMLSISQQIIKEQFSIGMRGLIGGVTGGGGFNESGGGGILGSLLGGLGGLFGGKAKGGLIRRYASGGYVDGGSGVRDDVPAMLTDGEYVLRKSAVNKYGIDSLNMLNNGGRVKGYAAGGGVSSMLSNSYDFFGTKGEKLTQNYTDEAFKTTVNAPSELANVPNLTGKFNINDFLSSRSITDENNPMNALRNQRFLGMQQYQEQASNFKTGYNDQYAQVEEQRRQAQKAADEENSRRMSAYNSQRSQMIIGGLTSAALSAFSSFSSAGSLGGPLKSFFGGGGGGGGGGIGGSLLSSVQSIFGNVSGNRSSNSSMSTTFGRSPGEAAEFSKQLKENIERGQFSGYGDPFSKQKAQLFPQFGGQNNFGGGYGGTNYGQPSSSFEGFQYGVGLGAPAGFQTRSQTKQDYLMNFASPISPIAPGRGNLVYDFLNQNSNPFGYAKGGKVKRVQNFEGGGYVQVEFDKSAGQGKMLQGSMNFYDENDKLVKSFPVNSGAGSLYPSPEGDFSLSNLRTRNQNETKGAYYSGGIGFSMDVKNKENYNKEALLRTDSEGKLLLANYIPEMRDTNKDGTVSNKETFNQWKTAVENNDFMFDTRKKMFRTEIRLHPDGGAKGSAGCIVGACPEDQQEIYKMLQTGNYKNIGVRYGQSVLNKLEENGVIAQAEPAGLRSFSEKTMLAENAQPKVNAIIASKNTPAVMGGVGLPSKSSIPDINRNQSTFSKEAGKGILAGGVGAYGLKKIIDSKLGQEGLMSTLRSAYGGAFKSSLLPSRNYGSNFVKPATARDKMFLPLNTPPTIMPKQLIAPNEMADILKYAKSPAMGPAGKFAKVMPKELVAGSEAANILKYAQSGALKPSLLSRSLSSLKGFGAGILKGAAFAPATEFLTPPSLGPTKGTIPYEIEMGYRNLSGQLTPLGERVLGADNPRVSSQAVQSINQQDFLEMNKQSPEQILPFFQNLADMASENKQSLYQSVGSLYDMKNKGDYGKLSSKFSSFYGNNSKNRYSSFGEKGFNNYLKYIGASPYSTMSSLNSFKFPMTPNTYSPFAFGSQNFGGFGGSGYQSGFSSTGNAFSNYFSTGSRLGITPSWASRANGGMIYGGTSAKDDVPAMLMGGEYVIKKDVVDRMGSPFFNRLNRGQVQGFAEGGPVGTGLPSVGGGANTQQDNSRGQFVESMTRLVKSLEQLNKGIEEQNRESKDKSETGSSSSESSTGVTNNININVNVDQNGKTTDSTKEEDQSGGSKEENNQEKFKKTMEKSRVLAELLRQQVLKTIVEEQRPGGVLYGGSKGRDMGR